MIFFNKFLRYSSRFRIEPSSGLIDEEESIQFTIYFVSDNVGEFEANLFVKNETGTFLSSSSYSSLFIIDLFDRIENECLGQVRYFEQSYEVRR